MTKTQSLNANSKKSSFSKKSHLSVENDDEDFDKDSRDDYNQIAYLYKINGDFDLKKNYEEAVLKIMNEQSMTQFTEPKTHDEFGKLYPNKT